MRTLLALFALIFVTYSQNTVYNKVSLDAAARSAGAVCLDGTPGAYYFRPGSGSGTYKWYIHHEGGGWCYNLNDCYGRSKTPLGSSSSYPNQIDLNGGYFSVDPTSNPLMYNWNSVYLRYCDGASFSGNNDTVTTVNGSPLHWRGKRILSAMFDDLYNVRGLKDSTDVVVSGCSAGGLATYLHLDWWKSKLPVNAKVVGMPDSGFFLDYQGPPQYHSNMVWVFTQQNSTSGVNDRCIAEYNRNSQGLWHCMFAQHTSPFIQTPFFPLQSEFDSWQIPNILGSNDAGEINKYGDSLVALVKSNVINHSGNSIFLDSCYHHCGDWNQIHFDGLDQANAFKLWYNGDKTPHFQNKPYPCSGCCQ